MIVSRLRFSNDSLSQYRHSGSATLIRPTKSYIPLDSWNRPVNASSVWHIKAGNEPENDFNFLVLSQRFKLARYDTAVQWRWKHFPGCYRYNRLICILLSGCKYDMFRLEMCEWISRDFRVLCLQWRNCTHLSANYLFIPVWSRDYGAIRQLPDNQSWNSLYLHRCDRRRRDTGKYWVPSSHSPENV